MSRAAAVAAALALATGVDLVTAAAGGYLLRTDPGFLALLDALLLAAVVLPLLAAVASTSLLRRAPRSAVALTAVAPVLVLAAVRATSALAAMAAGAAAVGLGVVLVAELRARPRVPGTGAAAAATAVGLALVAAAIAWPLPGRALLHSPEGPGGEAADAKRPNLLVIVLDTVRADHVGLGGYDRSTSPWLDRFAAGSTVFTHAISSSSWTLPAHATLFTGLFPRAHGADLIEGEGGLSLAALGRLEDAARARPLAPAATTLAELARDGGLDTGAVCANTAYLYRFFGLDQGFGTYVDTPGSRLAARPAGLSLAVAAGTWSFFRDANAATGDDAGAAPAAERPRGLHAIADWGRRRIQSNERYYLLAPEVNALALRWLEARRDRRFFLFLNYMDAHAPYLPIGHYRRLFPDADAPQQVDLHTIRERRRDILPDERGPLVDAYDAEIRFLDDHLSLLFARLESWGLLDRTVVLVVGDHGESFGEHHEMGHGNGVYESEVHVPLLLRLPGQREGARLDRRVHLVDVLPTLVDLLGLPRPPTVQGISLLAPEAARPVPAVVFSGRYHDLVRDHPRFYDRTHRAVYRDPWKLISRSDGTTELYDVRIDPAETRDRAAADAPRVQEMQADIARFEAEVHPLFEGTGGAVSDEALERLRALGYVH